MITSPLYFWFRVESIKRYLNNASIPRSEKVENANCWHVDECITILPLHIGKINETTNQSKSNDMLDV